MVYELGIDPGPTLRERQARILAQDPGLAATPAPVSAAAPLAEPATVRAAATAPTRSRVDGIFGPDTKLASRAGDVQTAARADRP